MESEPGEPDPKPAANRLNYHNPMSVGTTGPGRVWEGLAGFCGYYAALVFSLYALHSIPDFYPAGVKICAVLIPTVWLIAGCSYLRFKRNWKGFIPGVFIGLGLSCLIGASLCFYVVQHI